MGWVWLRVLLLIMITLTIIFHVRANKFNQANKNIIIGSMYKDLWPYRITWFVIFILSILFLNWTPMIISTQGKVKLKTENWSIIWSLGTDICVNTDEYYEKYKTKTCSNLERQFWCIDEATWHICWLFDVIIASWSTLPASWSKIYVTISSWQTELDFSIYQWDKKFVWNNTLLENWILLSWIPKKPAWEANVTVYFNVDKYWYLSFKAVDNADPNNMREVSVKVPDSWLWLIQYEIDYNESILQYLRNKIKSIFQSKSE